MLGAGIAQWLERRTRDWKVAGSNPCWNGGRIFFSRVDFLCWLLFRYPFHPRVTTVARKKSRSFCQKCRWQVTTKHAYTLRIEPCFGIGHNLSLICQMTSEDIKHQLNNISYVIFWVIFFLFPQLFVFLLQIKAFFWTLSHPRAVCVQLVDLYTIYYVLFDFSLILSVVDKIMLLIIIFEY